MRFLYVLSFSTYRPPIFRPFPMENYFHFWASIYLQLLLTKK